MSTTGRSAPPDAPAADDVARAVREAPFVHVVAAADGDALAAAGLLAQACDEVGVPFQVSVARTESAVVERLDGMNDDTVPVVLGTRLPATEGVSIPSDVTPASVTAFEAADALGGSVDPTLALAGAIASECEPGAGGTEKILEQAQDAELVERRPGVAVPTDDLADGLAHSTLVHAGFSGNPQAAQAELAELALPADLDADAHRAVASMVALTVAGDGDSTSRAAEAVQRALRPYTTPDGPFATLGGYADVLQAVARERPGAGVALALGRSERDGREEALDAWREHATAAHAALPTATTGRYDGVFVARIEEGPVETVARLLGDFRSPEPVVLVVIDGEAGVVGPTEQDVGLALSAAVETVGGEVSTSTRRGYARYDGGESDETEFITAFREAL